MAIFVKEEQPRRRHGCLWSIIIFLVCYVAICGIMGLYFEKMFSTQETVLSDNTVYRIDMDGTLVEQAPQENPFAALMNELPSQYQQPAVVGLDQLLSNIALAKTNDKVLGIYLKGGSLNMGSASAKALRDALLDFKQSGKFILAYSEEYGLLNYYVASVADKVCINPVGQLSWNGLAASKMYFTRLLDKLGIEVQILKVGSFKSAVEPFFRTSMSEEDKQQTQQYLDGIWNEVEMSVSASRHISRAKLSEYADQFQSLAPTKQYLKYGLVDTILYVQDMDTLLRTYTGTKEYKVLNTSKMTAVKRADVLAKDEIAVLYAEGEIYSKTGDGITDVDMIKQVKKILGNDDIKAVVLRVNSPGGSADASEQIWHAVTLLREKGLPVVVSMGDYAASGGYYISSGADYIYAEPTTITGSIGIFGMVPNFRRVREKFGVDVDGIGTHHLSGTETNMILSGMNREQEALMQGMVERGYDLFTKRVAKGRAMSQDKVKSIGEGRVWLGKDAVNLGLIDELGGIQDAICKAAELASMGAYKMSYYPEQKDPWEEILSSLENSTEEEKMVAHLRTWLSQPRVMALMPKVEIR